MPEARTVRSPSIQLDSLIDTKVTSITSDSRQVKAGTLFVAIKGHQQDGHEYISVAERAGALRIVGERKIDDLSCAPTVPYVAVTDSREALSFLAARFYGNPSHTLKIIGITGTSGKTTTSYLLEAIFKAAGERVGIIGTIEIRFENQVFPSASMTTPDAVDLQKILSWMKQEGATVVIMEVSSHALRQKRVAHVAFDGMIFTNLSPEHLDFHIDMEDYFQAKKILFTELAEYAIEAGKKPIAAISVSDSYGKRLLSELHLPAWGFQVADKENQLKISFDGISGCIYGVPIQSSLTGEFNASNLTGAVLLALKLGLSSSAIESGIVNLKGVPGRLEKVENLSGIHIWVDYAHKPDALQKVLVSLRQIRVQGGARLIVVFGCGGDRDRQKRPQMGQIAVQYADHVFITSDNPRTEDPQFIIEEILKGIPKNFKNFTVVIDRKEAITAALLFARKGDRVLIAGKGHETYQILGNRKIHFDDREVALEILNADFLLTPAFKNK